MYPSKENNAKSAFYSEMYGRAKTARSASAKVGGSKSKKCSLPSDNLTPAQKARLNGPVITYRMVPGHSDEELARWPEDLRQEYIERFRSEGETTC